MNGSGIDSSDAGLDLTVTEGAGYDSGLLGQALSLSSQSTYAYRAENDASLNFGSGDFTIQVWANHNSVDHEQILIEKFSDDSGPGWTLSAMTDGRLMLYGDGLSNYLYPSETVLTVGSWNHIIAQRDGSSLELFVNGSSVGSLTISGSITSSSNGVLVGRRNEADGRDFSTNGRLDEVAVWSRALSSDEITALYNDGVGQVIPEPATLAFLGLFGGGLLALRRIFMM